MSSIPLYAYPPLLVFVLLATRRLVTKSRARLPPGPKPLPIIGNLPQFPRERPWLTFEEWRRKYGDVVHINVFGQSIVVLNSRKACTDLLEKRSALYSNRPHLVMLYELMGYDWDLILMPYSARWRQHRRVFHQYFNEKASRGYVSLQQKGVHKFLKRLLQKPEGFLQDIRLTFAETTLRLMYDIKVQSYEDKYVQLIEKTIVLGTEAGTPGRYLVDLLPILKYVPSWVPGAGFQKMAATARQVVRDSTNLPAEYAEQNANGHSKPAVYSSMLEMCENDQSGRQHIGSDTPADIARNTAAIAYIAGADTTTSTIQTFFLIMANNPGVQKAAQAELDSVIGADRLPTFEDMQDLPYICAIVKEVLRWHSAVPLGVAHRVTEDDIYEGYLIPKGAIVMPNTWSILHDPEIYPDPFMFKPSRWLIETPDGMKLNKSLPDPSVAFGYGRRICPGRHFALNLLYATVSNVLACFNILPLDESDKPCNRLPEAFTDGISMYPVPYKASIVPRSERISHILKDMDL